MGCLSVGPGHKQKSRGKGIFPAPMRATGLAGKNRLVAVTAHWRSKDLGSLPNIWTSGSFSLLESNSVFSLKMGDNTSLSNKSKVCMILSYFDNDCYFKAKYRNKISNANLYSLLSLNITFCIPTTCLKLELRREASQGGPNVIILGFWWQKVPFLFQKKVFFLMHWTPATQRPTFPSICIKKKEMYL